MHQEYLLHDIGLSIVAATVLAYAARVARQPLILAYLAAGVVIGPIGLNWIKNPDSIPVLAELGLAFLMFIVGLEIDLKKLLSSGLVATGVAILQVIGCAILGWLVAIGLGYTGLPAIYLGVAVAFSSTMIVVKLLSDRNELDTIAGRVTLGVLLMQDVAAIVVLAIQPNVGAKVPLGLIALSVVKGLGLIVAAILIARFVLPWVFRSVAKLPELMLLSAISWCFLVCYAATMADFSIAMGALVAGVSMSAFPYSVDVVAKIRSLRDFFVTLFFVSLGMLLKVPSWGLIVATLAMSTIVIASRFATVWPALRLMRFDNRVGLLCSIHIAQVSEFSLVIVLLGVSVKLHHIGQDVVSIVVMTLVITSTLSTYMIQFSHRFVALLLRNTPNTFLEDSQSAQGRHARHAATPIMLVGCFRVGSSLVNELLASGKKFSVVDFSPQVHSGLQALGVPFTYGDISHLDTLEHTGVEKAKILISSIPDDFLRGTSNLKLLDSLRRLNPKATIIVCAESIAQADSLYRSGADYVLLPRILAASHLLQVIEFAEIGKLGTFRHETMRELTNRREVIP